MSKEIRRDPNNPATAREDIERTRQRMSGTLDQIEDVLLRKKEELEEKKADLRRKLDVGGQIRDEPLLAAGIVLGAGFLIGFLTGGSGRSRKSVRSARKRGTKWENRARRLLEIARDQEHTIESLQAVRGRRAAAYLHDRGRNGVATNGLVDDEYDLLEDDEALLDADYDIEEDEDLADFAELSGEDLYPLDPDLDDETIEYRPASERRGRSLGNRFAAFAADTVESILKAMPTRR